MQKILHSVFMPFTGILLFMFVFAIKANAQQTPTITTDLTNYPLGATGYILRAPVLSRVI